MNTPNNAAALLPCPFCGGAVQFRKALWPSDGNTDAIIHVAPTACGMIDFDTGRTDESVIDEWNRRATHSQPDAALDRLEQKWREEAAAEWTHCQNKELSEWVRDRCYGQHNRLLSCADELAALRATLAQPDALTSQPSGEAVAVPYRVSSIGGNNDGTATLGLFSLWHFYSERPFNTGETVYVSRSATHPSADAPGVAVDDEMVNRALKVWYGDDLEAHDMRAALTAALEGRT